MQTDPEAFRHQLAVLAQRKKARELGWPRDWQPGEVISPETGEPFTPDGAWEFIAQILAERNEIPLESVRLEKPAGANGFVLHVPLAGEELYIKLQLGSGRIFGRSFHYSTKLASP
jgi:hypothetical protein